MAKPQKTRSEKKLTRAQAERTVACTEDLELLRKLAEHQNKHVKAKATRKIDRIWSHT
jgi:hypothetical protein